MRWKAEEEREFDVRVVDGVEGRGRVEVDVSVVDEVEGR